MEKYKVIDLFSGIGGIRLGFQQVLKDEMEVVFSSEIDKFAAQTYKENYNDDSLCDITKVDEKEIPKHDIILAGFPCQAFSQAGLKRGFEDTRGTLFFDVARIAAYHKPQLIFLENVKGFKGHDKGNTYRVVKQTLEDMGYKIFDQVLNSKDFGLPQNRERIFIIATLNDVVEFKFPAPPKSPTKLAQILQPNPDDKYTLSDKLWEGHQRRLREHREKGNGFGFKMFNEDSVYTSTISARYYKDGSEILVYQEGKNPRKLTPREAGLLQGFPKDFKFPCSDNQTFKQCGNSVSVPVIQPIATEVKRQILDNSKTNN